MKSDHEREALRKYIDSEIMTSGEVSEMLGFTRQYLNQLIQEGHIQPIRKGLGIYLKKDIKAFKNSRGK